MKKKSFESCGKVTKKVYMMMLDTLGFSLSRAVRKIIEPTVDSNGRAKQRKRL